MANGLLDYLSGFGATPPEYLGGLLGQEAVDKLKGRAATTGIANAVLGYLAAPKNQNLGLGRILGQSLQAGMTGAQGVYDNATQDYLAQQKISDLQRKQAQQAQMQSMIAGIQDPNERLFAELAPEQYVAAKLKPMERKFEKIGNQLVEVSGATPTVAFTGTAESNLPSAVQEYNFAVGQGYKGNFADWKNAQKPAGTTINMGQEKAENKAVGEYFGKQYSEIQSAGYLASNKLNKVSRLNNLLEGVNTGKLTPAGVEIASTAQSLGFTVDPKLGNKQAAEALTNEMALELRNPSGGAGMPGAMSDADRQFLRGMVPGIEKTPEGRKMITESMVKLAKRDQEVAKIARDYRKKNGMINEGFYEQLNSYATANPLFPVTQSTNQDLFNKADSIIKKEKK